MEKSSNCYLMNSKKSNCLGQKYIAFPFMIAIPILTSKECLWKRIIGPFVCHSHCNPGEDYNALCGGEDGLNVVRDICSRMQEWCYNSSQHDERSFNATCWMELDSSHPCSISSFLETEFPHISVVQSLKDMSGLDRFVQLQVQPTKRN
jgi:hypothetical protein